MAAKDEHCFLATKASAVLINIVPWLFGQCRVKKLTDSLHSVSKNLINLDQYTFNN